MQLRTDPNNTYSDFDKSPMYRYSFQGQEKDDEVVGASNSINYTYRMHDVRVGRFFAVDLLAGKYPMLSTYQFSSNNPIGMIEIEGLEGDPVNENPSSNNIENQNGWSVTLDPGYIFNIDFAVSSQSGTYTVDNQPLNIESDFHFYDSRGNWSQFEGDQANQYVATIQNDQTGITVTAGVIHDKREHVDATTGDVFRYDWGGTNLTAQVGYSFEKEILGEDAIEVELNGSVGAYWSFNNINVNLTDPITGNVYTSDNSDGRNYSGSGFVTNINATAGWIATDWLTVGATVNGNLMAGSAFTQVTTTDSAGNVQSGQSTISVPYSSFSIGVGITFKINF